MLAGVAAAAPLLAATVPAAKADIRPGQKEVLVLGAGMAGLTAALSLLRRGHKVTVIEFQNRIGGRLLSVPLMGGQFSEAGGGHFRSNMPYTLSYIRRFKLPILALNDGLPRYFVDGKTADGWNLADRPWPLTREERNVTLASSFNRYLFRAGLDTDTVLDATWPDAGALEALDDVTIGDLLRNHGASEAFCQLLSAHAGTFSVQAQALAAAPRFAYHFGSPALFRVQGGNNRLPMALANTIGIENIVLGEPVTEIDDNGPKIRVVTASGKAYSGDAVISTIPFSVLGDVKVNPGWSSGKLKMFQKMLWDKTVKVIAQTKSPVWLEQGAYGWPMAGGDRPWERVIDITGNEGGGYGNVFFYLNDKNAEAVLAHPRQSRADVVVKQFQQDMPSLLGDIVMTKSFAWSEQPWIKGSFGAMPLGGGWMIKEWLQPEGRIHFAGDFTTLKTGWVEGAIESGLRAARQVDPDAKAEGNPAIRQEKKS
ncbi:flavin monoamine oxidase family protein [Acidisoma silvae]|uniref:FAD-dependent oxidoreductase n=1 Tax=Acidisoma silvae TaxID=2802396 RepID=A0A963YSE6_9PROT|nr:NAD(P)/FAD-dependent oxidoreductase [Acidisoma silvae]MCB8875652.1 FAD-dependent oxidoreductase [Acidisoma silvae]